MTSMVERVARAICSSDFLGDKDVWAKLSPAMQGNYRDNASAAIEAMREPTEAMTKVAAEDILTGPGISAFLNWQDLSASRYRLMIDVALSEDQ